MSPRTAEDWPDEPTLVAPQLDAETVRLRYLWPCVLHRAVLDAKGQLEASAAIEHSREQVVADARLWFRGAGVEPGSFRWVCAALDLDPGYVRGRAKV